MLCILCTMECIAYCKYDSHTNYWYAQCIYQFLDEYHTSFLTVYNIHMHTFTYSCNNEYSYTIKCLVIQTIVFICKVLMFQNKLVVGYTLMMLCYNKTGIIQMSAE